MLRNFFTVSSWTILSRILGLIRDQCLAMFVGAGFLQDTYQVASRLPNMFRRLFGEGAFSAAFVPLFSSLLTHKPIEEVRQFVRNVMGFLLIGLTSLCLIGELFMPELIALLAPGFTSQGHEYALAVSLCRITFPYLIFICAVALLASVLNGVHRYGVAAASYLIFNLMGIGCILGGYWSHTLIVKVAAWGILGAGILQFLLLLLAARKVGFAVFPFGRISMTPQIRLLGKRILPGLIGSGAGQINLMVDTIIGTLLPAGSISVMYFADRLNQLPLGIIGAACGTTLLPILSYHLARYNQGEADRAFNKTLIIGMIFSIPAATGLFILACPLLVTLFGHGAFHYEDALRAAQCLCVYSIGLPAFVLIKILTSSFFAHGDTRTPVRVGLSAIIVNVFLNLIFMKPLSYMGPPLASSLSAMMNVMILYVVLYQRQLVTIYTQSFLFIVKIVASSIVMAVFISALQQYNAFPHYLAAQLLWLVLMISLGALAYFATLLLMNWHGYSWVRQLFLGEK